MASGKKREGMDKKLAVLEVIKNNKEVLFGSFSGIKLNHSAKEEVWTVVLNKAKSLGLASTDRNWTFARDSLFGVWKSRSLAKRDNARKTGTGGGGDKKYDEIDEAIFEILEKESPVLDGLGLQESDGSGTSNSKNSTSSAVQSYNENDPPIYIKNMATEKTSQKSELRKRKKMSHERGNETESSENLNLQYKKLKNKLLEIEIYKQKLEVLKLEREMGLLPSKHTLEISNCDQEVMIAFEIDNEITSNEANV